MSSSPEAQEILESIVRPLRFAARRAFKNLAIIKGLEGSIAGSVEAAIARLDGDAKVRAERIKSLASGLDGLALEARKKRISEILQQVEAISPDPTPPSRKRPKVEGSSPAAKPRPTGKRIQMKDALPNTPLVLVVGVGPKTAERMEKRDLHTVMDALLYLPRRYEDRSQLLTIAELNAGESAAVRGRVLAIGSRPIGRRRRVMEIAVGDETGSLSCRFFRFRRAAMESSFARGTEVMVSGKVTRFGAQKQMVHPEITRLETGETRDAPGILPVYGEIQDVPGKKVRTIVQGLARAAAHRVVDYLPKEMLDRLTLAPLSEAIRSAHNPESLATAADLRRRLVFDELFFLQLAMAVSRNAREAKPGIVHSAAGEWRDLAKVLFPFALTDAQMRVAAEISADLESDTPMHRLLQGDVGSGKTAVALIAAVCAWRSGKQAVLLAPTEILAAQHFQSAARWLTPLGLRTEILTGSSGAKERRTVLGALEAGAVNLLVGTHAVLEDPVRFNDFSLAIVDEQHRFGVAQRTRLRDKREDEREADLLVMTATPIPRTLSLTAYGDLRVSVIDEMPPGRTPVDTRLFSKKTAEKAYRELGKALAAGRQAYVVHPLVETSEKLDLKAATEAIDELQARYSDYEVALLHGRMKGAEKTKIMGAFSRGEIHVLVATTVVEVGVDVPNATVIVVEDAERFGLSQLHQLRGRVGRGEHPGACLLISRSRDPKTVERLHVMEETTDGFVVAERDLQIRGPGEVLGTRQSGLPDLALADIVRDAPVLEEARREVEGLLAEDAEIEAEAHIGIRGELHRRFARRFEWSRSG